MAITINRKYLRFRWLAADLILSPSNAPWLSNVLKIVGETTPSNSGLNNQTAYAGSYNGASPGGTLAKLVQNVDYTLISGIYNGWALPTAIEVFNLPNGGTTTPVVKLDPPTGLSATALDASRIGFSWNQRANASGYRLRVNGSTLYMPGTNTSYVLTGLTGGTTASGEVQALGTGSYSDSDYSPAQSATTPSAGGTNFDAKSLTFTRFAQIAVYDPEPAANGLRVADYDFAQSASTTGLKGYTAPGGTTQGVKRFEGEDATAWGGGSYGDGQAWSEDSNSPALYSSGTGVYSNSGNQAARTLTTAGRYYYLAVPTDPSLGTIALLVRRAGQADVIKQFDQSGPSSISKRRPELTIDMGSLGKSDFVAVYSVSGYADFDYLEAEDGLPAAGPATAAPTSVSGGALDLSVSEGIYYVQLAAGPQVPWLVNAVDLLAKPAVSGGTEADLVYGCGQDHRNYAGVVHHVSTGKLQLTVCVNGQNTYSPDTFDLAGLSFPLRIGFTNTGNLLTALVGPSGGALDDKITWEAPISFNDTTRYSGSTPDKFFILSYAGVGCSLAAKVSKIRAGHFGLARLGDNSFVTNEDGSLYQRNGKVFMRGSARPFSKATSTLQRLVRNSVDIVVSLQVSTLGPGLTPIWQVEALNFKDYGNGSLYGEASGHLMWDRLASPNEWRSFDTAYSLLTGDSTAQCRILDASSTEDMLAGVKIFHNAHVVNPDPSQPIAYDSGGVRLPDLTYRRGFSTKTLANPVDESKFWPDIVSTTNLTDYTVLNNDKGALQSESYEGTRPCRIGGRTLLSAASRKDVRHYNAQDGSLYGVMALPAELQNLTFAPHFAAGELVTTQNVTRVLFATMTSDTYKGQQYIYGLTNLYFSDQVA